MHFFLRINGKIKTGGPKAMFQLGECLQTLGLCVSIVYDDDDSISYFDEWHSNFLGEGSGALAISEVLQIKNSFFVLTETALDDINVVDPSNRIWLYMLSVDNCNVWGVSPLRYEAKFRHLKNFIKGLPSSFKNRWSVVASRVELVLSQSSYANEFLSQTNSPIPYYYIGDYIDIDSCVEYVEKRYESGQKLNVAYNPSKGRFICLLAKLMNNKSINFIPIQGVDPNKLVEFFGKIDAYVDFGGQPGKDRLPREALLCGVASFQFKRGAAINGTDFPCTSQFRFNFANVINLYASIYKTLTAYDNRSHAVRVSEIRVEKDILLIKLKQLISSYKIVGKGLM